MRKTPTGMLIFLCTALILLAAPAGAQVFQENFNSGSLPSGWSIVGAGQNNWFISSSSNAGGSPYELEFSWSPSFVDTSRMTTPNINVSTAGTYTFSFRMYINHFGGPYTLAAEISLNGGTTWGEVWSRVNPASSSPSGGELVSVPISLPVTSTFKIAFKFKGDSFNINYWYIDNVSVADPPLITITSAPPGCVAPGGSQNVEATIISNSHTISETAVWFKKNAGSWYNAGPVSVVGNSYTFTINHATFGGVVLSDIVYWYLAAKDNTGQVTTYPLGGSGNGSPPGSTPPPTPAAYSIQNVGASSNIPYYENFDGPTHGFTFGGTSGNTWTVGTGGNGPYSGPNSMYTGAYQNSSNAWATSPVLNFSTQVGTPVITFWHRYALEGYYDGGWVEVSSNCGATWVSVGGYLDPNGLNWYDYSGIYCSGQNAWSNSTLGPYKKSVLPLPAYAGQSAVQIRFHFCSDASVTYSGWNIDDIAIGVFPQKDIQVYDAQMTYAPQRWSQNVTQNHNIVVTVKNGGWEANPSSVTLTLTLPPNAPDTRTFTPTWSGNTATITWPGLTITPAVTGPVSFTVQSSYPGDQNTSNDIANRTFQVQTMRVFGYEQFENLPMPGFSPGWTVSNGGGTATWMTSANGATGNSLTYPGDNVTANDVVVSPPAFLQAGSSYRIRFKYRSRSALPQSLDLLVGTSPNPANMTTLESWNFSGSGYVNALGGLGVSPFFNTDPASPQNYYIAFKAKSAANMGALDIDDVILDENPTPPPKIGYGPVGTAQGQHIDNPTIPLKLSACFKKPGNIVKTYEVVSTTYNYGAPGDFLWWVDTPDSWLNLTISTPAPRQYPYAGAPNGFNPPRPRQGQTFTINIDPTRFAPGTYTGVLHFYGTLFNADYPIGVPASNQILNVQVQLTITDCGGAPGASSMVQVCRTNMGVAATPYPFNDSYGQPVASVKVTSGFISDLCITKHSYQLPKGIGRYKYILAYWNISTGATGWTADINWYYTHSEMLAGGVNSPGLLRCIVQLVDGGVWTDPTPGVTSSSDPINYLVTGSGYNNNGASANIAGNHALVHDYYPKAGDGALPTEFSLAQNYPNPFNPQTQIGISVPYESRVKVAVYNNLGEEVDVLVDDVLPAGNFVMTFDGSDQPSGTYVCRMTAGSFTQTRRMMLMK